MLKKKLLILGDSDAISWKLRTHLHSTIWLGIGAKLGDQVSRGKLSVFLQAISLLFYFYLF